jgi:hypothetical protein
MALVACPECEANVSDRAVACVKCGFPVAEGIQEQLKAAAIYERWQLVEEQARERATRPCDTLKGMCQVCQHWQYVQPRHCGQAVKAVLEEPTGEFRALCATCSAEVIVVPPVHCGVTVVSVSLSRT